MQREDVAKRLFVGDVEYVLWADAVAAVEAANARAERAEAERDAAFAAGQRDMRERAAQTAMGRAAADGVSDDTAIINAAIYIRALPIKDGPDGR